MTLGEQIKKRRNELKITQDELAEKCGLSSKRVIFDYESGRRNPSLNSLQKLASVLDCEVKIMLEKNQLIK